MLQTLVLDVRFFGFGLVCVRNVGFAADEIRFGKLHKVGVEKDGLELLPCFFGAVCVDEDGLSVVGGEGHFILFQSFFPRFRSWFLGRFGSWETVKPPTQSTGIPPFTARLLPCNPQIGH